MHAATRGSPEVGRAEAASAIGVEIDRASIRGGGWMRIGDRRTQVAELCDQDRRTARLTIGRHRRIVDIQGDGIGPAREVEVRGSVFPALQIEPARFEVRGVDVGAQIRRWSPTQVVTLVGSTRDVDVVGALATGAVAREEQQMPIDGNGGRPIDARAIHVGPQIDRVAPGAFKRGAPRHPDVAAAQATGARRDEIKTQLIGRKRRVHLTGGRIDRCAEVHRLRPLGVSEGHGLELGRGGVGVRRAGDNQSNEGEGSAGHGASFPLGVRGDIQMSRPPTPPGRIAAQVSVRPSCDKLGCCSWAAVFSGAPRFTGEPQGSWTLWRADVQRSPRPRVPGRLEEMKISLPSARSVAPASLKFGTLSSTTTTVGPQVSPSRVTEAEYISCVFAAGSPLADRKSTRLNSS